MTILGGGVHSIECCLVFLTIPGSLLLWQIKQPCPLTSLPPSEWRRYTRARQVKLPGRRASAFD